MSQSKKLTVLGHIRELRGRLIKCVIAFIITSAASLFLFEPIMAVLKAPAGDVQLIFIEVTEGIGVYMRVCLVTGIIIAMPYFIYQLLMFITPALTRSERRMVYMVLPWVTIMFAGGVAFGYYVLIPPATKFLLTFGGDIAVAQIRVGNYVTFVSRLLLAIGLVFELPVLTTFLARIGVVTSQWLASKRRIAIVFAFVLSAVITPTIDPFNQGLVAIPLIILYEMGIWLAKLVQKKKAPEPVPAAGGE